MNKEEIVEVLDKKLKAINEDFSVNTQFGDLCVNYKSFSFASFTNLKSTLFFTEKGLTDELDSFAKGEENKLAELILAARYFYNEAMPLLEEKVNE